MSEPDMGFFFTIHSMDWHLMTQRIKGLDDTPDDLRSITHTMEREPAPSSCPLTSIGMP